MTYILNKKPLNPMTNFVRKSENRRYDSNVQTIITHEPQYPSVLLLYS